MAGEQPKGAVPMTCRCLMLLGVAALLVTLVGLALSGIEGFFMGGLKSSVSDLQSANAKLQYENQRFQQNNRNLERQLNNLTALNEMLNLQVEEYTIANQKLSSTISRLNQTDEALTYQVDQLEDLTGTLKDEVENLQNKTETLEVDIHSLQNTSSSLSVELQNLEDLRNGIAEYSHHSSQDFSKGLKTVKSLYQNLTHLTLSSQKVFFFSLANNVEFLDQEANFSQDEYEVFINQSANLTGYTDSQLLAMYPYDKVSNGSEMTYGDIKNLINTIVAKEEAEWTGNSTSIYLMFDNEEFDEQVVNVPQEVLLAEVRRLLSVHSY
eukprot:TRINITY_DN1825_c0_g2_i3.p1 TRINITY_DN1825_c0_g2~~TRINITY_DN1825_c0_g2_i3.p1  ORF type:complete len:324 (-),score=39.40 TRINITY_DN1825_c0_g2_i3:3200-4171(-)